jgi:antitoxin YefM
MTKVLSISEFRSNLAVELEHVASSHRNQIIVKRPKGKGNIVVISQDAFNSIQETLYLLSSKNNKKHLLESIKQSKEGKVSKVKLKDLSKKTSKN